MEELCKRVTLNAKTVLALDDNTEYEVVHEHGRNFVYGRDLKKQESHFHFLRTVLLPVPNTKTVNLTIEGNNIEQALRIFFNDANKSSKANPADFDIQEFIENWLHENIIPPRNSVDTKKVEGEDIKKQKERMMILFEAVREKAIGKKQFLEEVDVLLSSLRSNTEEKEFSPMAFALRSNEPEREGYFNCVNEISDYRCKVQCNDCKNDKKS